MMTINWHPSPREMRRWALVAAPALGLVGSLFFCVDWGIFSGGQGFAKFLWSFGGFAFLTGMTGGKLGLPAYWAWMGLVFVVSWVITHVSLGLVYFLVVTPLGLVGRIIGRDRLQLRARSQATFWCSVNKCIPHDPERQF